MIRKIILGLLLASLSSALIYGGVYRTAARLESGNEGGQANQRQNLSRLQQENSTQNINRSGNEVIGNGYQGGGNRGSERTGDLPRGALEDIRLAGSVFDFNADFLSITTDEGKEVLIENRAWRYTQEEGFIVNLGDQVELSGFYDVNGVFELSQIINRTNGLTVDIRDVSGRPYWAGGGGGSGQGGRSG